MSLQPRNRAYTLLGLLVCVAAAAGYHRYRTEFSVVSPPPPAATRQDGMPGVDVAEVPQSAGAASQPPYSAWLSARTKRYAALFSHWQCDVLVVPVQVEGAGFDRPNREIMSGDLALALASRFKCVTDPFLVDLALGEAERRRSADSVVALARLVKAKTIVTAYAGHDDASHMHVTIQVATIDPANASAPAVVAAHGFRDLEYGAERMPFQVFHAHLREMLGAVGLSVVMPRSAPAGSMPQHLPDSPVIFTHATQADALTQASQLVFLGMLAPAAESRAAERLFCKAWLALENSDDNDPAVRLLRARILYHLYERPLALAVLKGDSSPEADGLRVLLNGNLPQARHAFSVARSEWQRFFLGLEVHDLELRYNRSSRTIKKQVVDYFQGSPWALFAAARVDDHDQWGYTDALTFKTLLDEILPIPGYALRDVTGSILLGQDDYPAYQLLALQHVHRLVEQQPQTWCCASFSAAPVASDLLDLLDSRIEFALFRQAYFLYTPQGAYGRALSALEAYDSELAGNPYAEELRMLIYWAFLEGGELDKREDRNARMHAAARLASWWAQGESEASNTALWYLFQPPQDPAATHLGYFGEDYPMRPYWRGHPPTADMRLEFSSDEAAPLGELVQRTGGDVRLRYLAELETRFRGSPSATTLRLDNIVEAQKTPEYLRTEISGDPDNWELYRGLGRVLLRKNDYAGVSKAILSYPPFHDAKPNDSVALAGYASAWASDLYWLGAMREARPLMQLAAGYENGSFASNNSKAQLAILDGDYGTAAATYLVNARHYDNFYSYQDCLNLLFASGHEREAWATFERIVARYRAPSLWDSAMVGHRKAMTSETDLQPWISSHAASAKVNGGRDDVLGYAFMEHFTDRAADSEFPDFMRKLAGPADVQPRADGKVYPAVSLSNPERPLGPSHFGVSRHPRITSATDVPNRFAVLADAFTALRAGRYDAAVSAFDRLSSFYAIEDGSMTFVLPYFAFAAAQTGDKLELEKFLDELPPEFHEGYDAVLAQATFAALGGRHDEALSLLETAFHDWPYAAATRELKSSYEYLDVCASLYEATHDERYRQRALGFARILRQIQPARAAAHALVGYLGDNESERLEALGVALYLDPRSYWASKAPKPLILRAQTWIKKHHPFALDWVPSPGDTL